MKVGIFADDIFHDMWYFERFCQKIHISVLVTFFRSHKMQTWVVSTNKVCFISPTDSKLYNCKIVRLTFSGEIPTFVAKEGENVVLSCPVNTPGRIVNRHNNCL